MLKYFNCDLIFTLNINHVDFKILCFRTVNSLKKCHDRTIVFFNFIAWQPYINHILFVVSMEQDSQCRRVTCRPCRISYTYNRKCYFKTIRVTFFGRNRSSLFDRFAIFQFQYKPKGMQQQH